MVPANMHSRVSSGYRHGPNTSTAVPPRTLPSRGEMNTRAVQIQRGGHNAFRYNYCQSIEKVIESQIYPRFFFLSKSLGHHAYVMYLLLPNIIKTNNNYVLKLTIVIHVASREPNFL